MNNLSMIIYLTHARRLRSDDGTLILLIDGQQIQMSHIRLPSNDNLILAKNVYLDAIDEYPPPFETESDQLVIFITWRINCFTS